MIELRPEPLGESVFIVERRLLMDYYPDPFAGLSDVAFRKYILACRSVRPDRDDPPPYIIWNDLDDMVRAAGFSTTQRDEYERAMAELHDKHFLKPRPEFTARKRPDPQEVLLLPDYIDGYIRNESHVRLPETLKALRRGYIQVPRPLAAKKNPTHNPHPLFHEAVTDETLPNGTMLWAVTIKLYQYNQLLVHGGMDPNVTRLEDRQLWIHPSIYEELHLTRDEFMVYFEYLKNRELLWFQPIRYRMTNIVGTQQIHYLRDAIASEIEVVRLKYNEREQWRSWDNSGRGSL